MIPKGTPHTEVTIIEPSKQHTGKVKTWWYCKLDGAYETGSSGQCLGGEHAVEGDVVID